MDKGTGQGQQQQQQQQQQQMASPGLALGASPAQKVLLPVQGLATRSPSKHISPFVLLSYPMGQTPMDVGLKGYAKRLHPARVQPSAKKKTNTDGG